MDLEHRLAISCYQPVAVLNGEHHVYLVQHQQTRKIYVKKVLDVYRMDIYRHLFEHPVPGIPKIIDLYEENHQLTVIEEYMSGTSLSEVIASHTLTGEAILKILTDLCRILDQLHMMNPPVIHRDLKPSNILITPYQHAVLLDFNAAKPYSPAEGRDTVLLGTQGYAAPEQYGFGSSSPQTDIYALGIVLKEMADSDKDHTLDFTPIISRCTKLNPNERFGSIRELQNELNARFYPFQKEHLRSRPRSFLPPGYRTRTPWKMILATLGYLSIFWMGLTLEVEGAGIVRLWIERFFFAFSFLAVIFYSFDYLQVQRLFPICRSRKIGIRILGIVLIDALLFLALILFMHFIESVVLNVI